MGCSTSKPKNAPTVAPSPATAGEIMLRADGTVRTISDDQLKAQELKAQESAKRLAEMMAELGLGGDYKLTTDSKLLSALQRRIV